ncbi:MAG: Pyrophosphate-energized proton pump, partial [uncultured Solirubrobacteraceae bacterium]
MSALHLAVDGETASLAGGDQGLVVGILVISLVALGFAGLFAKEVLAAGQGTPKMIEIAKAVQEGAAAYLRRQFTTLAAFAVLVFLLLFLLPAETGGVRIGRSLAFLAGASFSALVGFIGMTLATRTNLRVANAANTAGTKRALRLAFRAGGVVGMFTVGLGLLGAAGVLLIFDENAPLVLEGFAFGAALLAMFMRVGGGIFTKAADVGADLVGKVEQGIPEDDPRNAATIADNVGDNVGDCAGMAADLFESYAVTLVAALILGQAAFGSKGLVFPLIVPAIGVLTALVGIYATSPRDSDRTGMNAINRGFFLSAVVSAVLVAIAAFAYLPGSFAEFTNGDAGVQALPGDPRILAIGAVVIGILLAAAIQVLTGYFTETTRKPVKEIGKSSLTGAATVVLAGISVGAGAVRRGAGRHRPAHHRRRHRRDGHLRPDQRQRAGHRGDVRRGHRGGRADPHRARRGRQHHQGDHQGHRDRDRGAGRDRAVRVVPRGRRERAAGRRGGLLAVDREAQPAVRPRHRRGRGVPVLRPGDQRRG